jgi:hypothetical protein
MSLNRPGKIAQRIEVYSAAYKIVWGLIPSVQRRTDISLRIHASIRRQLKEGATDARVIALAALKDVLVSETPK